jgi:hypothetical protein
MKRTPIFYVVSLWLCSAAHVLAADCSLEGKWQAEMEGQPIQFVRIFSCLDERQEGNFQSLAYVQNQLQSAYSFRGRYRLWHNTSAPPEEQNQIEYKSEGGHDWNDVIVLSTKDTVTLRSYYSNNVLTFHHQ